VLVEKIKLKNRRGTTQRKQSDGKKQAHSSSLHAEKKDEQS
jgi:hypothetical protein